MQNVPARTALGSDNTRSTPAPATPPGLPAPKGCAVATQPAGDTAADPRDYLHSAKVAEILHVSPKTVARWAKDGKLPFLKTLGGHRRYPAAAIRQLAEELRWRPTA
jgi:excisionase family DNA binding protein